LEIFSEFWFFFEPSEVCCVYCCLCVYCTSSNLLSLGLWCDAWSFNRRQRRSNHSEQFEKNARQAKRSPVLIKGMKGESKRILKSCASEDRFR
jgi:hypothetical protein